MADTCFGFAPMAIYFVLEHCETLQPRCVCCGYKHKFFDASAAQRHCSIAGSGDGVVEKTSSSDFPVRHTHSSQLPNKKNGNKPRVLAWREIVRQIVLGASGE